MTSKLVGSARKDGKAHTLVATTPSSTSSASPPPGSPRQYPFSDVACIQSLPGRENAVVALSDISPKQGIRREKAWVQSLSADKNQFHTIQWCLVLKVLEAKLSLDTLFKTYDRSGVAARMWDQRDDADMSVISRVTGRSDVEIKNLHDLICGHAISIGSNPDMSKRKIGLFRRMTFVKHHCFPNAAIRCINEEDGLVELFCLTAIRKGEEITVSQYCDPDMLSSLTPAARRDFLLQEFGAWCNCSSCVVVVPSTPPPSPSSSPTLPIPLLVSAPAPSSSRASHSHVSDLKTLARFHLEERLPTDVKVGVNPYEVTPPSVVVLSFCLC